MQEVVFLKEENRRHALVRLTLHLEQELIDDLMEVASRCGIAVRSPEYVIRRFLEELVRQAKAKG